jgi:hypothetical protein
MFGTEFAADLIEDLGNGLWKAVARTHTGRTVPGTQITVKQSEILEASAAEMPSENSAPASAPGSLANSDGLTDLNAAMETERKTLPSPADLIAQHRENLKEQQAVSVPPGPTQPPAGRQLTEKK